MASTKGEADGFGASGRILLGVRQYVMDGDGPVTKSAVRRAVKGDNNAVDDALVKLASDPNSPVQSEIVGQRVRYVWDADRVVASGALEVV